jgi:hypothetical protein
VNAGTSKAAEKRRRYHLIRGGLSHAQRPPRQRLRSRRLTVRNLEIDRPLEGAHQSSLEFAQTLVDLQIHTLVPPHPLPWERSCNEVGAGKQSTAERAAARKMADSARTESQNQRNTLTNNPGVGTHAFGPHIGD